MPDSDAKTEVCRERQYYQAGSHDGGRHRTALSCCEGGLGVAVWGGGGSAGETRSGKIMGCKVRR